MSTIFGGDTGMSYEDVQRKRKIAEALLAQNMRTPQSLPEGLNAIGRALAARSIEKKTGKAMEGLTAEADSAFNRAMEAFGFGGSSAGGGASYPTSPAPIPKVGTSTEGEAIADDAMATLVRMGLVERGLPEHVADGFVMNAKDESGLRTDINEIAPLVPGSRGGFGLMQWTGPRRVALEQEAARRGVDPSDLQLQLDTIVSELQGPEARAGQSILSTKDAPSAATAIVNDFLRPAPQHRAARAAAYSGGGSAGGSAGGSPSVQQIAAALSNPINRNDPGRVAILNAMLGQAMKVSEPVRGVTMGDRLVNPMTGEVMADFSGEDGGAGNTDYSLTPQYVTNPDGTLGMIQLGKDGSVNVVELPEGLALQKGVEKLDLGTAFQWYNTVTGEPIGEPIPKDIEGEEAAKARGKAEGEAEAASEIGAPKVIAKSTETVNLIDSILSDPNLDNIVGKFQGRLDPEGWSGLLMSQDQVDLAIKVKQLQGRAFMEAFETLKGGGQITEREGAAAQAAIARLQRVQGGPEYRKALNELRTIADNARRRAAGEQVPEYVPEAPAEPPADRPSRSSARVRYDAQGNRIP